MTGIQRALSGSTRTRPVKKSAGPAADGRDSAGVSFWPALSAACTIEYEENIKAKLASIRKVCLIEVLSIVLLHNAEVGGWLGNLFGDNWTGQILLIGYMFHPLHIFSIEHLGDCNM